MRPSLFFGEISDGANREYLMCRHAPKSREEQGGDNAGEGDSGVLNGHGGFERNRFSFCLGTPAAAPGWRGAQPLKGRAPPWCGGAWSTRSELPADLELAEVKHLTYDLCSLLMAVLNASDSASAIAALRALPA